MNKIIRSFIFGKIVTKGCFKYCFKYFLQTCYYFYKCKASDYFIPYQINNPTKYI